MNNVSTHQSDFYVAQLTIKVLTRNETICNEILDTIAYAANCVENEYPDTVVMSLYEIETSDQANIRILLDKMGLDMDEIGLAQLGDEVDTAIVE